MSMGGDFQAESDNKIKEEWVILLRKAIKTGDMKEVEKVATIIDKFYFVN